jgi:hypothetical protein
MRNKKLNKNKSETSILVCSNCFYHWRKRVDFPKRCPECGNKLPKENEVKTIE